MRRRLTPNPKERADLTPSRRKAKFCPLCWVSWSDALAERVTWLNLSLYVLT